jgi:hypothetical protein
MQQGEWKRKSLGTPMTADAPPMNADELECV